jgi:hypothetical protein
MGRDTYPKNYTVEEIDRSSAESTARVAGDQSIVTRSST